MFGVPDDDWGERVHAAVQLRPDHALTADELSAFARQHVADYKVPREVSFHADFPRDSAGKLLKRVLRDPHWAGRPLGGAGRALRGRRLRPFEWPAARARPGRDRRGVRAGGRRA